MKYSYDASSIISYVEKFHPEYLDKLIPVGICEDGRRCDHSSANGEGMITVGPANDNASFPAIRAAMLMWHLREEKEKLYFRTPALGRGGPCRVKIARFEWVPLRDFLGMGKAA